MENKQFGAARIVRSRVLAKRWVGLLGAALAPVPHSSPGPFGPHSSALKVIDAVKWGKDPKGARLAMGRGEQSLWGAALGFQGASASMATPAPTNSILGFQGIREGDEKQEGSDIHGALEPGKDSAGAQGGLGRC